jgi:importin subunit alpha-6/7
MKHKNLAIAMPMIRCIGNIVTGDEYQTQIAINGGVLLSLNELIQHSNKMIRKEVCWVLSNITAGPDHQI